MTRDTESPYDPDEDPGSGAATTPDEVEHDSERDQAEGDRVQSAAETAQTDCESRFLRSCLETRQPFVVDKVNATRADRDAYLTPVLAAGYRAVAYWLDVRPRDALARNAARSGRARTLPAILGTYKRLELPSAGEGFSELRRAHRRPVRRGAVARRDRGTVAGAPPAHRRHLVGSWPALGRRITTRCFRS